MAEEIFDKKNKTLKEAQDYVFENLKDGIICPCCEQHAKIYKRSLNRVGAEGLISLCRMYEKENRYFHVTELGGDAARGGDFAKLKYYDFIESKPNNDSTKKHSGYWKPTKKGIEFAHNKLHVQKYYLLYDGIFIKFEGKDILIEDAFKTSFDYQELMSN